MVESMTALVEIHWVDSIGLASWQDRETLNDTSMSQRSVGWLVGETDDAFILSATIGDGHDAAYAPLKIPKVSVIDFWTIKL